MTKVKQPELSEKEWQGRVVGAAQLYGWMFHHCRPAWDGGTFRTPIQGNAGFPDLVLSRKGVIIFAELKSNSGSTTDLQDRWLGDLAQCRGVLVRTWRPKHWASVLDDLK